MLQYVIFGDGRVGANMTSYLQHLGHQVSLASRAETESRPEECAALIEKADIVAAAIPDDKLEVWRDEWRSAIKNRTAIHFSGAVSIEGMHGFHPLYSFPKSALDAEKMSNIAFACPQDGPSFDAVFPHAKNPHFRIAEKDRAHYHALAVLSGNLASYVWNETAKDFSAYSDMAPELILRSYLKSIVDRFTEAPAGSMTGPIARKDGFTVAANLAALERNPNLQLLYKAFLNAAWPDYEAKGASGGSE